MMAELADNEPVYNVLQFLEEKLEISCVQVRAISSFWMTNPYIKTKKALFICILDQYLTHSWLPWLDFVLVCLDGIGLK